MKRTLVLLAAHAAFTTSAYAQESATAVETSGQGELNRASEVMIGPEGRNIPVRLPATVRSGEVIVIEYESSGNPVTDSFMVTGISIKNGVCALESQHQLAVSAALKDVIHTRPCKKLE